MQTLIAIPNFPGYAITRSGEVFSAWKNGGKPRISMLTNTWKQIRLHKRTDGYLAIAIRDSARKLKFLKAHRVIAELFVPNPNGLKEVAHLDGDPSNNDISNLLWVDRVENEHHKKLHGRASRSTKAKLNISKVKLLKLLSNEFGWSSFKLAQFFSVSRWCVRAVLAGKSWGYVI